MIPASTRRAMLLSAVLLVGCDVAKFALDRTLPSFEQTWNLPGATKEFSVASLLPPGKASVTPDGSAFSLTIDPTTMSAQLGPNCAACLPLNGTNANKPAFTMAPGSSTPLPTDITSAAITAGQIAINLTNNLTFDPLYVNTGGGSPPQGTLIIVVRSGSVVLGRDSLRGAATSSGGANPANTPFAPGVTLNRTITLNTGTVTTSLTVDVSLNSPIGDHPVPIDVSKFFNASASVPSMIVATVTMNVPGRNIDTGGGDLPLKEIPGAKDMYRASLLLDIVNPFAGTTGALTAQFAYGPSPSGTITKPLNLAAGSSQNSIPLDTADVKALIKADSVTFKIIGPMTSSAPIPVTPQQKVSITARLLAVIRTPTGEK